MTFSTIIFFVTALLLLTSVKATLTITNPTGSTTWTAGKPATITWVNSGTTTATVPLILLNGPENKLKQVLTIAESVDVNKLTFTFTVPSTVGRGSDYTVQIGDKEPNYSARFTIISNATSTTASSTTSNTSTTSPTSKPATTKPTSSAVSNNTSATNSPQPTRPKSAANTVVPALYSLTTVLGAIVLLLLL
uniref:Putative serine-rich protein C1E8.05 n=1 Tax=Anthurium amnicola TaxID=1678845 RepID=A0A1D1YH64_9ARAE